MLDVAAIEKHLGEDAGLVGPIRALTSVSSTNDIAWAWAAAGCAEGAAFFAEEQVLGRGRFGRTWACPRGGGLLLSLVLRPADPAITPVHLTAMASLAAAEAVERAAGLTTAIRWPNDVTVAGRKMAGVLVERRGAAASTACVVGVGLNVNVAVTDFPVELRETATSLLAVAGRLFEREAVAAAWRARCALVGEQVEVVESAGKPTRGCVVNVDPLAGIELELRSGKRRVFAAERATVTLPPSHETVGA